MTSWLEQQVQKAGIELIYREKLVELVKMICQDVVDFNVRPQKPFSISSTELLNELTKAHAILTEMRLLKEAYDRQRPNSYGMHGCVEC